MDGIGFAASGDSSEAVAADARRVFGWDPERRPQDRAHDYLRERGVQGGRAMGGPRWTEQEDSLVRALYPAHGAAWDGWSRLLPGKTRRQVTYRANRMGVYSMAGLRHRRPRWSAAEDAALRDAVAAGLRTRREMGGAVPGKGADAAYQRARKLGLIGGRASPAAATGPWPTPAERRALAAALRRMVRDGADMTDRGWVAVRLAREAGVDAASARAWMKAEWGRKR